MAEHLQKPCAEPGCKTLVRGKTRCPSCAKAYDGSRGSAHARGYGKAWRKLSKAHLAAEPLCRECLAQDKRVEGKQVDHILPREEGGTDDPSNLQSLCESCHSRKTALANLAATYVLQVEVVCGPPGSGREAYILKHMTPGDLLLDDAEILAAISGLPKFQSCDALLPMVEAARNAMLELARARQGVVRKVWVLTGGATAAQRASVLGRIEPTTVTTRQVTQLQCRRRLEGDEYRCGQLEARVVEGIRWRVARAREEAEN